MESNRAFLEGRLEELRDNCACEDGSSKVYLQNCVQAAIATFNRGEEATIATFIHEMVDYLESDKVENLGDLVVPAEFDPSGEYCVWKDDIRTAIKGIPACYDDQSLNYSEVRAEFLNSRYGWNRTEADYELLLSDNAPCLICGDPTPKVVEYVTSCRESLTTEAVENALVAHRIYLDETRGNFVQEYEKQCLDKVDEQLQANTSPLEYHYTLYYYDQAGNLSMTVPPAGVVPIEDVKKATIKPRLKSYRDLLVDSEYTAQEPDDVKSLLPNHKMLTDYVYNTFNEVTSSDNPDKDATRSWFDELGRIVLSQDGRQADKKIDRYSYTIYDCLGRVVEVGEMEANTSESSIVSTLRGLDCDNPSIPFSHKKFYVTRTYYNESPTSVPNLSRSGETLRNRVAMTTFTEDVQKSGDDHDFATHYDYDIAGNVKTLVQDFAELDDIGQRYKRMDYDYDLISGNVHNLFYQKDNPDHFTYHYKYDKTNRLTDVYTSEIETDFSVQSSTSWKHDVAYTYYDHGPLKRQVIGQDRLQGLDFAYTLQGWIKGVNSSSGGVYSFVDPDMNFDGLATAPYTVDYIEHRDLAHYSNQYFRNDYTPISQSVENNPHFSGIQFGNVAMYNGNIGNYQSYSAIDNGRVSSLSARYDQLHRLRSYYNNLQYISAIPEDYNYIRSINGGYNYDENGNINKLERSYKLHAGYRAFQNGSNSIKYEYARGTNRLDRIIPEEIEFDGFQPFQFIGHEQAYKYDNSGNLIEQLGGSGSANLRSEISWTPYGKVAQVNNTNSDQSSKQDVTYGYGPDQNRWVKRKRYSNPSQIREEDEYQVRDAQGNTLATYYREDIGTNMGSNKTPFTWKQQYLYGSSRLGQVHMERQLEACDDCNPPSSGTFGERRYELTNHLGNVTTTFGENITLYDDEGTSFTAPEVLSHQDYLPFGLEFKRSVDAVGGAGYRYGFNGKEKDTDGEWGSSTNYDYGFRIYDPSIARFLSVDPLAPSYPELTPYQFASNSPIAFIDLDGLERAESVTTQARISPAPLVAPTTDHTVTNRTGNLVDQINKFIATVAPIANKITPYIKPVATPILTLYPRHMGGQVPIWNDPAFMGSSLPITDGIERHNNTDEISAGEAREILERVANGTSTLDDRRKLSGAEAVQSRESSLSSLHREINHNKQASHIVGTNAFKIRKDQGKNPSILTGDAQELLDKVFAGDIESVQEAGQKYRVDFGEVIGKFVNPQTGEAVETTVGLISTGKKGAHIVPGRPNE